MAAVLALILVVACGQTENIGGKLSPEELDSLRLAAAQKCLKDSEKDAEDFIASSNSHLLDYGRNANEWTFTYKKASTVVDTHNIYIWKVTSNAVFFRIRLAGSTPKNVYLKYTTTQNNDIMKNIQAQVCDTTNYKGSSLSSGGASVRKDDSSFTRQDASTLYKNFRTYTFDASQPAFFGELKLKLDQKLYDNNENFKSTTTYLYEINGVASPVTQSSANYKSDADYPNRYYCMVNSAAPTGTNTYRAYTFPIDLLVTDITQAAQSNLSCQTGSDSPTITVGAESFTPATEL